MGREGEDSSADVRWLVPVPIPCLLAAVPDPHHAADPRPGGEAGVWTGGPPFRPVLAKGGAELLLRAVNDKVSLPCHFA